MTEVSLREFLEKRICDLDRRVDDRFIALEKALDLQAENRQNKIAVWLSISSLVIAVLTLIAVLPKWGAA